MFKYGLRTKIFLILILISVVVLAVVAVSYNNSKSRDLKLVSQARSFAVSLEKFYDKYDRYPTIKKVSVGTIEGISENGVNQPGENIYFVRDFDWANNATVVSDDKNYLIEFELNNSWEIWQIDSFSGGQCRLGNNLAMKCISK